jgi:UDP-3-O-[3-hydroxymyristoyl] N-acetylglucosamine deacetylase
MLKQRTLKNSISAKGIGLHSGTNVTLTLKSAPINTGIVFVRCDLNPVVRIEAKAAKVGDTTLCTSLTHQGVSINTVEHLLSALSGLGIDNAIVEVDNDEIPIMDGSAGYFIFLIQSAGILEQDALKQLIRIKEAITVTDGDKTAGLKPFDGFKVSFTINFDHPAFDVINNQDSSLYFSSTSFIREISRARTFGFTKDIEALQANNLIKGGSEKNAIIIGDEEILNKDSLRYQEEEFVKHKILDAIGDLYLLGKGLIGEFTGYKSGHALNNKLIRTLLDTPDAWEVVTFTDKDKVPIKYLDTVESS